jgi:ABC-type multidrug transport system fused ATPase/permease subunit
LYRDPKVLILDEATSSLDSLSEQKIQDALLEMQRQGITIIVIAHRLSTVMFADKIIVLQKGKLVEEGSHDELMSKQNHYYELWKKQLPVLKEINGIKNTSGERNAILA